MSTVIGDSLTRQFASTATPSRPIQSTRQGWKQARTLNNLSLTYFALSDKKKCVEYLDQALAIYRAMQDRRGEALTLTNLGSAYGFLINDPHKALEYFQEAITKLELLNDRSTEADALELDGSCSGSNCKSGMAGQAFNERSFSYSAAGESQGEASVRKH